MTDPSSSHVSSMAARSARAPLPWRSALRQRMSDACLTLECLAILAAIRLGLKCAPTRMLRWSLSRPPRHTRLRADEFIDRFRHSFRRAAALLPGSSCLSHSIAVRWLLARNGITAELHVGFSRRTNPPAGHAWVEVDGRPVLDSKSMVDEFALRLESRALLACELLSPRHLLFQERSCIE